MELFFLHADLSSVDEEVPQKYKEHEKGSGFEGVITACDPPRRLSFAWGGEKEPSEVTFELIPQGGDVLLILTHRRLDDRKAMLSVASGWHTHLDVLQNHLEGKASGGFWSRHAEFEKDYNERFPAGL